MQKHLQAQAEESKTALRELDHCDWKQAESIAKGRYDKRFGTRARSHTVTEAITALKPIFSKDWVKPKKTGKVTQQGNGEPSIPLENRFQHLEEGTDEALDELLAAMDAVPPPSPKRGPRSGFRFDHAAEEPPRRIRMLQLNLHRRNVPLISVDPPRLPSREHRVQLHRRRLRHRSRWSCRRPSRTGARTRTSLSAIHRAGISP